MPNEKYLIRLRTLRGAAEEVYCEDCLTIMLFARVDRIAAEVRELQAAAHKPTLQEVLQG